MYAKNLMIGDWVYDEANKLYTKVITITPIRVIIDPYTEGDEQGLIGSDLKGIPLTEDILKANGFVFSRYALGGIIYECSAAFGKPFTHETFVYDKQHNLIHWGSCTLKHVHELQHALRLCGLNELADNFKLK